jgi:hypothetical protein
MDIEWITYQAMKWANHLYITYEKEDDLYKKMMVLIKGNQNNFDQCVIYCKNFNLNPLKQALSQTLQDIPNCDMAVSYVFNDSRYQVMPRITIFPGSTPSLYNNLPNRVDLVFNLYPPCDSIKNYELRMRKLEDTKSLLNGGIVVNFI